MNLCLWSNKLLRILVLLPSIGKPSADLKHGRVSRISEITLAIVNRRGLVEERAARIVNTKRLGSNCNGPGRDCLSGLGWVRLGKGENG